MLTETHPHLRDPSPLLYWGIFRNRAGCGARTVLNQLLEHVKIGRFVFKVSRVDAVHIAIGSLKHMLVDGILLRVRIEYHLSFPSACTELVYNREGVLTETIRALIRASCNFKDNCFLLEATPVGIKQSEIKSKLSWASPV